MTTLHLQTSITCYDPRYLHFCIVFTLLSPWKFIPWEIRVAFPQESQLQQSRATQLLINYKAHAGSFRVSTIHRTLTWTTGSLTCVREHAYACVYTRGFDTPTASHHNIFDLEKWSQFFLLCSWRRRGSNLGSLDLESDTLPTEPPLHSDACTFKRNHIVL